METTDSVTPWNGAAPWCREAGFHLRRIQPLQGLPIYSIQSSLVLRGAFIGRVGCRNLNLPACCRSVAAGADPRARLPASPIPDSPSTTAPSRAALSQELFLDASRVHARCDWNRWRSGDRAPGDPP